MWLQHTEDVCDFITPLSSHSTGQCPSYSIDQRCALSWATCYALPQTCRDIVSDNCRSFSAQNQSLMDTATQNLECNETINSCAKIDGLSADVLKVRTKEERHVRYIIIEFVFQYGACGRLSTLKSACPLSEQVMGAFSPDECRDFGFSVACVDMKR